ncbi:MAG: heavy-metal-associated domain-containing protein [Armatimonadota bacterium]|nr:heavy-metal-associated domain-containing protein [Armatimonadota bacterium]MDR7451962.1 heavy-metal-associated domain-containing protein [Armatimonadota bacterium]MDR7466644.1 heavy-metal-associated domain-containing protein [Armatimonadota bacterium]MDR7492882.1 heavy-metal-associated domain-containing protein [Armatimonadota bacterium]MDR7498658.1 heavy-metal-associated domain-containing protein [Armatimonadota bacterium]
MQTTLTVPKIHCSGCVQTVTQAVQKLPGVQRVQASHTTRQVTVEFDPARVDEAKIRSALAAVGYPPA